MIPENFLFKRVSEVPRVQMVTARPEDDARDVAWAITRSGASGAVVCENAKPIGIITDQDFRKLLANLGPGPECPPAREIMSSPVIVVDQDDYVFEAIYLMTKNGIRHLVMTDESGFLSGVITDAALMSVHTASPIYFKKEINACRTLDELKAVNANIPKLVRFSMDAGARTRDIIRLISMFNDAITKRLIHLIGTEKELTLPEGCVFLALGSEGRKEQTLRTDQDNALILADGLSRSNTEKAEAFAAELVDSLNYIGVPYCPGKTMATNPAWRRTESEWLNRVDFWISETTPESLVEYGMFQDMRPIHGDLEIAERLKKKIDAKVTANSIFMARVAKNVCRFPPPLGLFDRLVLPGQGNLKGLMDLKKAGIFALTEGASLLAVEAGITARTTWEKFEELGKRGTLSEEAAEESLQAFTFLTWLRLKTQLKGTGGGEEGDFIAPDNLPEIERMRLKSSLQTVKKLLKILKDRFHSNLISN